MEAYSFFCAFAQTVSLSKCKFRLRLPILEHSDRALEAGDIASAAAEDAIKFVENAENAEKNIERKNGKKDRPKPPRAVAFLRAKILKISLAAEAAAEAAAECAEAAKEGGEKARRAADKALNAAKVVRDVLSGEN